MTSSCSWDYYECTITDVFDPAPIVQALGGASLFRPSSAHRNYPASFCWDLESGGSVQVWYGSGLEVHVVLSSGACDRGVDVLRAIWEHRVSRFDVALDFDYPGAFDHLYPQLWQTARDFKPRPVRTQTAGDWLDLVYGRTLYLGSKSSRLMVRLYEKGHEQTAAHPDQEFSLDWVRAEWQIRPDSSQKSLASTMTPDEAACLTSFGAQSLALLAGAGQPARPLKRVPSTDPAYWLARQYGAVIRTWLALPDGALRAEILTTLERAGVSTPSPAN